LTDAEVDLLTLLVYIKRAWEQDHVRLPDVSPCEVVCFLLQQCGWNQSDLVRHGVFRTRLQASQVLNRTRCLTYDHAALAALFHVSLAVFFPTDRR
jgi:antitoxin component HigA of HigAB toxin-antitoxin module